MAAAPVNWPVPSITWEFSPPGEVRSGLLKTRKRGRFIGDKIRGGLAGKVLRVDLTREKSWTEDTEKYAREWIGGRAINSWLLFQGMEPRTKWSDPQDMVFSLHSLLKILVLKGSPKTRLTEFAVLLSFEF
jgi:hypothetical protein